MMMLARVRVMMRRRSADLRAQARDLGAKLGNHPVASTPRAARVPHRIELLPQLREIFMEIRWRVIVGPVVVRGHGPTSCPNRQAMNGAMPRRSDRPRERGRCVVHVQRAGQYRRLSVI